jgi:hypothetical protein
MIPTTGSKLTSESPTLSKHQPIPMMPKPRCRGLTRSMRRPARQVRVATRRFVSSSTCATSSRMSLSASIRIMSSSLRSSWSLNPEIPVGMWASARNQATSSRSRASTGLCRRPRSPSGTSTGPKRRRSRLPDPTRGSPVGTGMTPERSAARNHPESWFGQQSHSGSLPSGFDGAGPSKVSYRLPPLTRLGPDIRSSWERQPQAEGSIPVGKVTRSANKGNVSIEAAGRVHGRWSASLWRQRRLTLVSSTNWKFVATCRVVG